MRITLPFSIYLFEMKDNNWNIQKQEIFNS